VGGGKVCDSCRALLSDEDNQKPADAIESAHPKCQCEKHSVGVGSPGVVDGSEKVFRIICSPRDFNPDTGLLLETPFSKLYGNGLSVCRSIAADRDLLDLASEALVHAAGKSPPELAHVCEVGVQDIRDILEGGERAFCVYDQTVSRRNKQESPIPVHAGIFQRVPPSGTNDRRRLQRDLAGRLREKFIDGRIDVSTFRGGMLVSLNERAQKREFEEP
jgi:hypothetical protein